MDWLSALFMGGAALLGQSQASKANKRAAEIAAEAERNSTAAIVQGNQQAQARFDQLSTQGQPGMDYLRTVTGADPNVLTPQQQLQMEDLRRASTQQLAASGLRGSGRAVTASLRQVEQAGMGDMIAGNQRRSDAAASQLAGIGSNSQVAAGQTQQATGQAIGQGIQSTGNTLANAELANAGTNASTMGAIASIFANDAKDRAAEKRYKAVTERA